VNVRDLVFHGLAIKRHSTPAAVAELVDLPEDDVASTLQTAAATGRAAAVRDGFTLAPLARVALEARYASLFDHLRTDSAFVAAYERFEAINIGLKQTITDWQTVDVRGERVVNDHADEAYDSRIIDRLGAVHERVEPVLSALSAKLPRLKIYGRKLTEALEKAEDGGVEWVSDVRRESYHTVWFELHEDLLRIMGKARTE